MYAYSRTTFVLGLVTLPTLSTLSYQSSSLPSPISVLVYIDLVYVFFCLRLPLCTVATVQVALTLVCRVVGFGFLLYGSQLSGWGLPIAGFGYSFCFLVYCGPEIQPSALVSLLCVALDDRRPFACVLVRSAISSAHRKGLAFGGFTGHPFTFDKCLIMHWTEHGAFFRRRPQKHSAVPWRSRWLLWRPVQDNVDAAHVCLH